MLIRKITSICFKGFFYSLFALSIMSCQEEKVVKTDQGQYFELINLAEISYLKNEYSESSDYYKKAFLLNCIHFNKDLYNSAVVSVILQEPSEAKKHISELISKGASISFLKKNEFFNKNIDFTSFKNTESAHENNLHKIINNALQADQDSRQFGCDDNCIRIDSINYMLLDSVIAKYNFPSESDLGINDSITFLTPIHFLIWHQRGYGDKLSILKTQLRTAAESGKIHPNIAAKLIWVLDNGKSPLLPQPIFEVALENDTLDFDNISSWNNIETKSYTYSLTDNELKKTNALRERINMESYEDQIFKQTRAKKDTALIWFYTFQEVWLYPDSTSLKSKILSSNWREL